MSQRERHITFAAVYVDLPIVSGGYLQIEDRLWYRGLLLLKLLVRLLIRSFGSLSYTSTGSRIPQIRLGAAPGTQTSSGCTFETR